MLLIYRKTLVALFITTFSVFTLSNAKAANSDFYLQQIMNNTNAIKSTDNIIQQTTNSIKDTTANILQNLNTLPMVLQKLGEFINAWLDKDDSDTTANMIPSFSSSNGSSNSSSSLGLSALLNQDLAGQSAMQSKLNLDLLTGATRDNLPYANDLVYSSLLGTFFYSTDPRGKPPAINPQYNYIKNAAGVTIPHVIPANGWGGSKAEQAKYHAYYNTAMAVESFNAYVLSNQYIDGDQYNELQKKLITQASDPKNWFAEIASEKIGFVLRQLLIYQSQIFVLLTQLVQTQKQMATAQIMTNALLIAGNQANESLLLSRAQAVRGT